MRFKNNKRTPVESRSLVESIHFIDNSSKCVFVLISILSNILLVSIFGGVDFRSFADWLARRQYVIKMSSGEERNVGERSVTWLNGLFVRTLISRTNAYAGCGRPNLNFIERFVLLTAVPTASRTVCIQIYMSKLFN